MARFITVQHPKLKETATVAEAGFYAKGGLRDKGWKLLEESQPEPARPAEPEPAADEEDE